MDGSHRGGLTHAVIKNFQSVREFPLQLRRLVVITGPTGAGKSSVVRALHAVVFNVSGTSFITRGERAAVMGVAGEEAPGVTWTVTLQRTTAGKTDKYEISTATEPGVAGPVRAGSGTFTKLRGAVPEQVRDLLAMTELNFAGQFDPPFLLTDSGGKVAQVLGRLTNVTMLLRAAQEANRRRLEAGRELKVRRSDLEALVERAQSYLTLGQEETAVVSAEAALERARQAGGKLARLDQLTAYQAQCAALVDAAVVPPVPSLERMEALITSLARLDALGAQASDHSAAVAASESRRRLEENYLADAEGTVAKLLAEAGVCPVCGSEVKGGHAHA